VPDSLDAAALAALARLANANPHVGFSLGSQAALPQVLSRFRPRTLVLSGEDMKLTGNSASLREIETLVLTSSGAGSLDLLPALPRLRQLAISNWDVAAAGPLPAGLKRLKSLAIFSTTSWDSTALRFAPAGLEELSIVDQPVDPKQLARLRELRTLVLNYTGASEALAGLASLRKLEWILLPDSTSQAQFAAILAMHPGLRTLEIVLADSLRDLSPLRGLKHLQGLILDGEPRHVEVVKELRSLRYVVLECDSTRASLERVASLRKALPEALVVAVKPLCLGSGWILLLVPTSALGWFLGRRSRAPRTRGSRAA
jgi:hypothetical protein